MANTTIRLRKSGVTSNVPVSLELGELALNYADGKLYYKNASGVITYISSGATTNSFATINSNSSLILATSNTDILTLVGSNNITINSNTGTKTITIGASLTSSLFANSPNIGASANATAQLYDLVTTAQGVATYAANQVSYLNAYSNAAYAQANTATNLAQLAFNKANTGSSNNIFANTITANSVGLIPLTINLIGAGGNQNTAILATGSNTKGGIGYFDFLLANNQSGSANNSNKYFRLDSTGQFQIINSAYTQNLFNLDDIGNLTIPGNFIAGVSSANYIQFGDGTKQYTANAGSSGATDATARAAAQAAFNTANLASSNTVYTQGVDVTQNTRINSIETINTNQNTTIAIIQSVDLTQNTRLDGIEGTNLTQNTNITTANNAAWAAYAAGNTNATNITLVNQYAASAYNQANVTIGVDTTLNTAISIIQGVDLTQNTRLDVIEGVNLTQNTNITAVNQFAQSAYNTANTKFNSSGGNITGAVTISGNNNLTVTGNLYVTGTQFVSNTQAFNIQDPLLVLGVGNYTSDVLDIGFAGHYNDGTNAHSGLIRDYGTKEYYFFKGYTPELDTNNNVDINHASFLTANVNASFFKGNLVANSVIVNGAVSTSNTTGALVVSGGVGVKGNVATDGIIFADGTRQTTAATGTGGSDSSSLTSWTVINSNYTVGNNIQLLANSTGGTFTITLPASPVTSNVIVIADGCAPNTGWSNNNVLVNPNGRTIEGIADTLALNISQSSVSLIYDGATWQVVSSTGPKGDTGTAGPAGATGNTGPAGVGSNATQRIYRFNATNNQTIFVGSDAYSQTLSYNVNALSVYLNGVFLRPTEDYFANNGTTITLTSGSFANDALDVITFQSMSLTAAQNTITTYTYTASNNQTSFGGTDINGLSLNYNPNNLFVTLNGLTLRNGTDYLQTNTSFIQLTSGALANDELSIVAFGSFNVQGQNTQNTISTYYYTSTAGQTNFTGSDIYGNSLSYMQDGLIVVRNGSTLRNKIDYTATNGTSVSLANPSYANDEIAITAFGNFSVAANGYTQVEANNLFLAKADANNIFATTANTYTKAQANTQFLATSGGSVTGNTYFSANTFFNSTIFTKGIIETANIIATPIGANTNFDIITQAVQYYTANAASNTTINIRGNSVTPLNSLMNTGNTASIVLLFTNGANTYYPNVIQVDGSPVTPKWQSGTTVTAGNSAAIDSYRFTVIKTGNATFTVLASQTKFL